jgi:hypothetical protein
MTTAWTKMIALGLFAVVPFACTVDVSGRQPTDDGLGRNDGSYAGTGSTPIGQAGNDTGGSTEIGGAAGTDAFPEPTCAAETGDAEDACVQCLKTQCCAEWQACDDQTCFDEWNEVAQCVSEQDFPDSDQYGMCLSQSSASMDFVQSNTQALLDCLNEPLPASDGGFGDATRCGQDCFGTDIIF